MSEKQARRRRHLQAVIPSDKKKEMKERLTARHMTRNDAVSKIRRKLGDDIADLKHVANAEISKINDAYEIDRAAIIEKYEDEFGLKPVAAVLS